jgi:cytochrome c oxidase subunit 4
MSTSSPASVSASAHQAEESKFWIYVQIAMILAVITGSEIVVIGLPFAAWLLVTVLVVLSIVKFMFVIFYFMHLRWDKVFCTVLFFIGLIMAGGTMWALIHLFIAHDSFPLSATAMAAQIPAVLSCLV